MPTATPPTPHVPPGRGTVIDLEALLGVMERTTEECEAIQADTIFLADRGEFWREQIAALGMDLQAKLPCGHLADKAAGAEDGGGAAILGREIAALEETLAVQELSRATLIRECAELGKRLGRRRREFAKGVAADRAAQLASWLESHGGAASSSSGAPLPNDHANGTTLKGDCADVGACSAATAKRHPSNGGTSATRGLQRGSTTPDRGCAVLRHHISVQGLQSGSTTPDPGCAWRVAKTFGGLAATAPLSGTAAAPSRGSGGTARNRVASIAGAARGGGGLQSGSIALDHGCAGLVDKTRGSLGATLSKSGSAATPPRFAGAAAKDRVGNIAGRARGGGGGASDTAAPTTGTTRKTAALPATARHAAQRHPPPLHSAGTAKFTWGTSGCNPSARLSSGAIRDVVDGMTVPPRLPTYCLPAGALRPQNWATPASGELIKDGDSSGACHIQ
mmetsp:Transcript_57791/g.161265  ORF Transcript_57791/g.161265 Transcript_57791/m.161265 type:complete len:450 (-) Transcript_57791:148-1497(-)